MQKGEEGEIYIETEYMSLGYWDIKLNEGKFWKREIDGKVRLFYKTGDYGYENNVGEYVIVGRKDRQIKIDGIRMELDTLETLIRSYPNIKECAVIYVQRLIVAYVVSTRITSHKELREFLRKYVNNACIPKEIVFIDKIPLNQNGKIHYRFLKEEYLRESKIKDIMKKNIR